MTVMDKLKQLLKGHEEQVEKGVDKAAAMADKRTGGKYHRQIDTSRNKLKGQLGTHSRRHG